MSEHLSLSTCKRLKASGWPQGIGEGRYWQRIGNDWSLAYGSGKPPYALVNVLEFECYACPPIITADGKGGVLPWLHDKGLSVGISSTSYFAYPDDLERIGADSPEALINACLDHLEAQ